MNLISLPDLSLIVDNLEEGILFLDKDRHVLSINKSALDMIGKKEDADTNTDIINQLCPALFPGAHCARECEHSGSCSLMMQDMENEKVEEVTLDGPDNTMVSLNLRAIALSSKKTLARCAILLTNRTHERQLEEEVSERIRMGGLIGRSPPMQKLFQNILRAAASDATVLIEGESGTDEILNFHRPHYKYWKIITGRGISVNLQICWNLPSYSPMVLMSCLHISLCPLWFNPVWFIISFLPTPIPSSVRTGVAPFFSEYGYCTAQCVHYHSHPIIQRFDQLLIQPRPGPFHVPWQTGYRASPAGGEADGNNG